MHARRASAVAHAAIRDRVLGWSPGAEQASFAIAPEVGLASLSGQSEGFDYSGTSESASFGAETGAGTWQAGLVASVTNSELHYRAKPVLAAQGYRTGEHDTEVLSLHPFAAWHAPSGGHFWASIGSGAGSLSHRDDLGFRSWCRSDVRPFCLRCRRFSSCRRSTVWRGSGRSWHRVLHVRHQGRRSGFLVVAHTSRARLSRWFGVECIGHRRTCPVGRLQALDRRRSRGRSVGGTGLRVRRRHVQSASHSDRQRGGLVRCRRLRAGFLGVSGAACASHSATELAVSVWASTHVWCLSGMEHHPMSVYAARLATVCGVGLSSEPFGPMSA